MTDFFAPFRTSVQRMQYSAGTYINGSWFNGSYVNAATQTIVAGQSITISISGQDFTQAFDTDTSTTINALLTQLETQPDVAKAFWVPYASGGIGVIALQAISLYAVPITGASVSDGTTTTQLPYYTNPTITTIQASVQPLTGNELLALPEGMRDAETYKLWSVTQINGIDNYSAQIPVGYAGANADKILVYNKVYEVYCVKPWQSVPILFNLYQYEYYISRFQPLSQNALV